MIKQHLRKKGLQAEFIEPYESPIGLIWTALGLGMIVAYD